MGRWVLWLGEKEVLRKRKFKETERATDRWSLKIAVSKSQKKKKKKKKTLLTYSFSKIIEKYFRNSSFLVEFQTYSLQLYLKLNFFTCMFQRFC